MLLRRTKGSWVDMLRHSAKAGRTEVYRKEEDKVPAQHIGTAL